MANLKFDRLINISLTAGQIVTVPEGEVWKVKADGVVLSKKKVGGDEYNVVGASGILTGGSQLTTIARGLTTSGRQFSGHVISAVAFKAV